MIISLDEHPEMNKSKDDEQPSLTSVLDRIKRAYPQMTPTYQAVAEYMLAKPQDLAFASTSAIAKRAGTSPATVVRFADHVGLSGFAELQGIARSSLRREIDTVSQLKRTARRHDARSVLQTSIHADINNLERVLEQISEDNFMRAVAAVAGAGTTHLVGLRSTFGLVLHFEFYLSLIGCRTNVLKPGIGDLPEQIMCVGKKDVCIIVSFGRYARDAIEIFKAAKARGATTVAITDSELSPPAQHADLVLVVPVEFPAFFESRVALLTLINALVFGVALADRRRTMKSLKAREQAWRDHKTYLREDVGRPFTPESEAFAGTRSPRGNARSPRKNTGEQ
jgi:DNA-binding MurR/RpiR family transcriptional regulator